MIRAMTKDVEVGDTYLGAKVVKTTTFGAFVELTKGLVWKMWKKGGGGELASHERGRLHDLSSR